MQTKVRYPPILNVGYFKAVGSCHGIICVLIQHYVVFWNPSFGKFKISRILLDFVRNYGFGYDHLSDNYKVVAAYFYDGESDSTDSDDDEEEEEEEVFKKTKVVVHTLGTNCWRRIKMFPCASGVPVGESSGTFVSGAINWVTSKDGSEFNSLFFVVSLNLANESYQEIFQPDYGDLNVVCLTLGVLRDCLCIFAHGELFIDVWIMKEYGKEESWSKLFTIPFANAEDLGLYPCNKATYIYEDEQVLLVSRAKYISKPKLVVYDSKRDTFKLLNIKNIEKRMVPTVYVESLITTCS
ncbi:putative F-box associated interaction domain-containing protein [Medicago truncatula]|uniref:F-box protein interaction domain protein n=1 Tax=Medicago truncatula TaxID=3880 RepID=A0A072UT65_MEDTR|nr:F-box/kelch-repeat protein At3g23880 [Medicago truncatula]KEH32817.1 F-box protein interaction domain protein [Medicago truncatula]RHN65281.1 putative F-box associated interaction domain-containing protein [Medicago truncatula]